MEKDGRVGDGHRGSRYRGSSAGGLDLDDLPILLADLGRGSPHAYVHPDEKPPGDYRIVRKIKTPTQKIALVDHEGETWVYSNGEVMFCTTEDENEYAETLVHVPMSAAESRRSVLIIGGAEASRHAKR